MKSLWAWRSFGDFLLLVIVLVVEIAAGFYDGIARLCIVWIFQQKINVGDWIVAVFEPVWRAQGYIWCLCLENIEVIHVAGEVAD